MENEPLILVADDEANIRKVLAAMLRRAGNQVVTAADGDEAIELLDEHDVQTVVTDLRMPGKDGMELLAHVKERYPEIPVIIITAHGTVDNAVEAIKKGAFDYITKPFDREELKIAIDKAVRLHAADEAAPPPQTDTTGRYRIIGRSPQMRRVFDIIDRVAATPSTTLITGESGTGKELVACALHENSNRASKPFIKVNCAAIPKELIESELFGHEKGAFTGAVSSKPGRFELAHEGTLFLDEIAEIPPSAQVKLLRAIQQQEFERVGGIRTVKVDVRIIAATNRDLQKLVHEGRFREDLFYRLNVVPVQLPPLRERPSDVPLLAEAILARHAERLGKEPRRMTAYALETLEDYAWPGNIRELENVLERVLLFCDNVEIDAHDLPDEVTGRTARRPASESRSHLTGDSDANVERLMSEGGSLKDIVRETAIKVERDLIARALAETNGNVTRAARLLGISRRGLQLKLKELELR